MDKIQTRIAYQRSNLAVKLENLAEELTREARRIRENPNHVINSMGIVQRQGPDIDLLCARISALEETL